MLRTRLQNHLGDIFNQKDTSVANHFNSTQHNITRELRVAAIELVSQPKYRLLRESKLISYFGTVSPYGLNVRNDTVNALLPLKVPYSKTNALFAHKVKRIVHKSKVTKRRVIVAYKRQKNLGQLLCKL